MTYATIKGLDSLIGHAKKRIKASGKTRISIIGFFDLTGSTKLKVTKGHTKGTTAAHLHNAICTEIVEKYDGAL